MHAHVEVSSPVEQTPRLQQIAGMFDLTLSRTSGQTWDVELPIEDRAWSIGLITGPSGCGKSSIARHLFHDAQWLHTLPPWSSSLSIVDGFPEEMSVKEISNLLCSAGLSSPPAWLRPFAALSMGQQFRCELARLLGATKPGRIAICDEFTSVVDRVVAQVGSACVAKAVRARGSQFIAVSCHEDVIDWLQPDWIYRPAETKENAFTWRLLRRRPSIRLEIRRCASSLWQKFASHHYLAHNIAPGGWSFLASWNGQPIGFTTWLPFVGLGPISRREHRTVILPDYQGVGIGMALSDLVASMWKGLGYVARSTTTHPAFKKARLNSKNWLLNRIPSLNQTREQGHNHKLRHAKSRLTTGWRYIGEPMPYKQARALLGE